MVGFPAVGDFGGCAQVNRLVTGVGVEDVGDAGAGDDDAGVAVAGGQDTQAVSFQVEGGGVRAAGERVQDQGDAALVALEAVRGADADAVQARIVLGLQGAQAFGLDAVRGADGDVGGAQDLSLGVEFAGCGGLSDQEPFGEGEGRVEGFEVDAVGATGGQFQQCPTGAGGVFDGRVEGVRMPLAVKARVRCVSWVPARKEVEG